MQNNQSISIIGAGLVGSLMACFLAQRGFRVNLYEKRTKNQFNALSGRSINLSLSARGIKALNKVNLMEQVEPHLIPMVGRLIHEDQYETFQAYGVDDSCVHYSLSRKTLNKILLEAALDTAKVNVFFDHELEDLDLEKKQCVFKGSQSRVSVQYERLLATDGSYSKVRKLMNEATGSQATQEQLSHGYKELTLPSDNAGIHAIRKDALHIWPRDDFMLIALPDCEGSFTVTLFLSLKGDLSFESLASDVQIDSFFREYFPDVVNLIPDFLKQFNHNPIGNMVTVRASNWHYQDSVCLMGDAAHAIVPFHGQGMNCGFEDCEVMDRLFDSHYDFGKIFELFEQSRKSNANAIADMAIENYLEMRKLVKDPEHLHKKEIAMQLEQLYPNLFKPRYAMVMFDTIPYSTAYALGHKQQSLLTHLSKLKNVSLSDEKIQKLVSEIGYESC